MINHKKILFIFNGIVKHGDDEGISGGEVRIFEIIKNIKGFDKFILTTSNGKNLIKRFNIKYNKLYEIKYTVKNGIFSNFLISIISLLFIPKDLFTYKGEVYSSAEHLYDVLPALRLKVFNKCRWHAAYHWVEDYPWIEKRGGTPILIRYVYWLNRFISGQIIKHFADNILAVSEVTKQKLIKVKKINPHKIRAVNCGVNYNEILKITKKYRAEKGKNFDAVYMKRLNYGKGIIDLLRIWKLVVDKDKKAKLAIIGDGPIYIIDEISKFIEENKLNENIKTFGTIYDFEEKIRIINSAKLFILPSHEENWGIVIGEAMAVGLPVITYSLKEITPIWKDNVEWINPGNYNAFSSKILEYLRFDDKRKKLSLKGLIYIKEFDWKKIAREELIEEI
jgi:glycosyltransferase involved in cell wall biosynthesis